MYLRLVKTNLLQRFDNRFPDWQAKRNSLLILAIINLKHGAHNIRLYCIPSRKLKERETQQCVGPTDAIEYYRVTRNAMQQPPHHDYGMEKQTWR